LFLFAGFILLAKAQFLTPRIWEADGYYHIHVADVIRHEGFVKQFHWARYSYFAEHFADKEILYHVLLIPFTYFSDLFFGAKMAAWIFSCFLLYAVYRMLRWLCPDELVPLFLVLFFCSDHFLSAICRPRPMVPGIALMLLGIEWAVRRRHGALFWTTLAYGFMHLTAPLMVFFAGLIEAVRFFETPPPGERRRYDLKPVWITLGALAASVLLHPNFPNNLRITWLNLIMVPYYAAKGGVLELGGEFFPITTRDFLMGYPALLPALLGVILCSLYRTRPVRFETKAFFFASIPLFLGMFSSQRYLIHEYPLLLVWLAAHVSDLCRESDGKSTVEGESLVPYGVIAAALLLLATVSWPRLQARAQVENEVNAHYERMGVWMRENVPPGEVIFHANWSDSQYFIGINPKNDYFVTLDPTFMYAWNRDLYDLYRNIAYGRIQDPAAALRDVFHARFGYAGKNYFMPFIQQIARDPRFQILVDEPQGVLFMLR
jgi:hypothetical protein